MHISLMRRALLGVVTLAIFTIFAFGACGGGEQKPSGGTATGTGSAAAGTHVVRIKAGDKIAVGILAVVSGDNQQLGFQVRDAVALAQEQLGPVKGFDVQTVLADDLCTSSGAEPAATQILAEKGLVAVIGSICSGVNSTIQPTFEREDITQISPGSTAVKVTYPQGRDPFRTFLRTVVQDGVQGVQQAKYATTVLKAKTVYTAYDTDTYGAGLKDVFNPEFEKLGGKVLGTEGWEKNQTEFGALVSNVTAANPDLVYVSGFAPEAAAFLRQLKAAGYKGGFLGGDGVITQQFLTNAGADAEGVTLSKPAPFEQTPALTKFQTDFMAKFSYAWDRAPYGPEAYDAYNVVHKAIDKVAKLESGTLVIDLDQLNDAMHASDFDGLSGHISFDDHGDKKAAAGKPLIIFSLVKNGVYVQQEFE